MNKYQKLSDEDLMRRLIRNKDEKAFNELYSRYSTRILKFLYKMLGQNEALAQDFLQEVFLKIATAPEKFDPSRNFKSWVFTVTANHCRNHFRKNTKKYVDIDEVIIPETFSEPDLQNLTEFRSQLNKELNKINTVYREAFILRYDEGLSLKEIAEISQIPLGTVKSRLHSAVRVLAEKLVAYQPE